MTKQLVLIGVATLLLAAGCEEENPRLAGGINDRCTSDSDCPDGQTCVEGDCRDTEAACETDTDCLDGQSCVDGRCDGRVGPDCETDGDCAEGQVCTDGVCSDTEPACEDIDDCSPGQECIDGVCQDTEPECTTDEDCRESEICNSGQCEEPTGCDSDEDCEEDQTCEDGTCRDQICAPGSTRCTENAVARCSDDGLDEVLEECGDPSESVCLFSEETNAAECVAVVCEPETTTCTNATTVSLCNETGTDAVDSPCDEGLFCTDGVCAERTCDPFETGCLDGTTAYACTEEGTIEVLPCSDDQYCLDAQCFTRVCEPEAIACDGDTLVTCDDLGAEETRLDCNASEDCEESALGCTCADNACAQRICEAGQRRCTENAVEVCDERGVAWSDPEACGDDQTCIEGACLDIVCEPSTVLCDGEVLLECNDNGTDQRQTDCGAQEQLCDADAVTCIDRLCEPATRVCNGNTVFECTERGDAYEDVQTCEDGERCREGQCRDTCDPGQTRCEDNTLYICLDDGVNEDSRDCGEDAVCLDDRCAPIVCSEGQESCRDTIVTLCNDTRTDFDDTDVDCAEEGLACRNGECVRINVCPSTVALAGNDGAGVSPRRGEVVVPAAGGLFLDGRQSTDDTDVELVRWRQVTGPEGAQIRPEQDLRNARVSGLIENSRYVFEATAVDDEGLESCETDSVEVFTVSDDRVVVHLTWHDPSDEDEYDNQGADVDLHMVKAEEGTWAQQPYAVYYRNRSPDWEPERPNLLGDDVNGRGPEIITMDNPDDCQWYAVGGGYFRNPFQSTITLGWNLFLDGQLAYSSYERQLDVGQFVEEMLIHYESGEVFVLAAIQGQLPTGQRPTFSQEAVDSDLCGIPEDVIPPSCDDGLGDIGDIDSAAELGNYANLTVCADDSDYFGEATGTGNVLMADIETTSENLRATVTDDDTVIGSLDENGGVRGILPDDGPYYLRVYTDGDGPDVYSVRAVVCQEDDLAPNQDPDDSPELEDGSLSDLTVCGNAGNDWFHVDLEIGDQLTVMLQNTNIAASANITLYDPDRNIIAEELGGESEKTVTAGQVTLEGRYWVRVSVAGTLDVGQYDLETSIVRARIGIDLSPTDLTFTPTALIRGSRIELSATVTNFGARGATFSTARVNLQNSQERFVLGTQDQDPFPAQSTRTDDFTFTVPEEMEPGTYDLCFAADTDDVIPEVDEENNLLCEPVQVTQCFDLFEPNSNGEEAIASDADWFTATERDFAMDTCPTQDVDVYYADVEEGDHQFCTITQSGARVSFRLYHEDDIVVRNGPNTCIEYRADESTRFYFSVWQLGGQNRVPYRVTYSEE